MQVEMSLAELLINAIAHGRIPGVQFKRGWASDRQTFDGLQAVIADRLDGARRVAVEQALHKLQDEHPTFKMRHALRRIYELGEPMSAAIAEEIIAPKVVLHGSEDDS